MKSLDEAIESLCVGDTQIDALAKMDDVGGRYASLIEEAAHSERVKLLMLGARETHERVGPESACFTMLIYGLMVGIEMTKPNIEEYIRITDDYDNRNSNDGSSHEAD